MQSINPSRSWLSRLFFVALTLIFSWLGFSGAAQAQEKFAACKPVQSGVFANRIHMRCEYPVDGKFLYFAAPTSEPRFANRALSVILSAQLSGKVVTVAFNPMDQSGGGFGCLISDCRNFSAILLEEGPPPGPPPVPPSPARCTVNPNDVGCPAFCTRNPTNPACVREPVEPVSPLCRHNPAAPGC
jgi:hypothetical protein